MTSWQLSGAGDRTKRVRMTLRVKSDDLDAALKNLRALGSGEATERITSKDVTEQWIDLDARLRTQKALEAQYLKILKDASEVGDLLEVQKKLAEVRTEIEKLESKKRLLDRDISLSTITLELEQPAPLVTASLAMLGDGAKHAGADVVNTAGTLAVAVMRAFGTMLPVLLLIVLPCGLFIRWAHRRLGKAAPAKATAS